MKKLEMEIKDCATCPYLRDRSYASDIDIKCKLSERSAFNYVGNHKLGIVTLFESCPLPEFKTPMIKVHMSTALKDNEWFLIGEEMAKQIFKDIKEKSE